MKKVVCLGATGIIGEKAIEIINQYPSFFQIVGLSGYSQKEKLLSLQKKYPKADVFFLSQQEERKRLLWFLENADFDLVLLSGFGEDLLDCSSLVLLRGKTLALASKEVMVGYGHTLLTLAKKHGGQLLPIDSELFAIWSCLFGHSQESIRKVFLMASGGPFLDKDRFPQSSFASITPQMALQHPRWKMGKKISLDSATYINKAFEFLEIIHFFSLPPEKIEVVIHPEAELHGMVEFQDGSLKASISFPEMKIPITRALFYPDFPPEAQTPPFSLLGKKWEFSPLDEERFPSIQFAKNAFFTGRCSEFVKESDYISHEFLSGNIQFHEIFSYLHSLFGERSLFPKKSIL